MQAKLISAIAFPVPHAFPRHHAFPFPMTLAVYLQRDFLKPLLKSEYSPRRDLYMAHHALLWTNVVSDIVIALSYVLFFFGMRWLVRKLRHIPEIKPYLLVVTALNIFIIACGATVVLRVVTIWFPLVQFSLGLKVICAAASLPTAIIFALRAPDIASGIVRFFELLLSEQQHVEALRKSEDLLDRTGKVAGIGGWEVDLLTNSVTWSTETYRVHGASPDYRPTLEEGIKMYAPEARPEIVAAVMTASSGGPGWDLELPVIRFDGRRIWVRSTGEVDFRDGTPVRLVGSFQDITDSVGARNALREATERVKLAADSGGIGIWDWNIATNELYCDDWMHRLHGKTPSEVPPGDLWRDHLHPDDREFVERALQRALEGLEPYNTEFRIVWQDESVHTLRGSARVTHDADGRAVRMVGANWDVTESRRLTNELAQQHELLRVTLQSIADGVITTEPKLNVDWLNPAAERMTGWSTREATGRPLDEVFVTVDPQTREPVGNPLSENSVPATSGGQAGHALLISRDKVEYGIENTVAPIRNTFGVLLGNILVFRDVTEQRRLAAETERNNQLKSQLKLKDEFLSHVSHELRSPLTSIYSFTSIIADGLAGESTPEQQDYLHIILKNVVQLQAMIEDLLTVTQSREGKLSIDPRRISLCQAMEDAIHTAQSAAVTKKIALTAVDCKHLPDSYADPTRIRQVLIILLDNAIKFTPSGGSVTISATLKEFDLLQVQVTDSGCGIPADKKALVFENLYQVTGPGHTDTSHAGRTGLGLGLHIARNLVNRQGGNIWVTDAPGGGSIFNFTVPMYTGTVSKTEDGEPGDTPQRRKTDPRPEPTVQAA